MATTLVHPVANRRPQAAWLVAWAVVLFISSLPAIVCNEFLQVPAPWLFGVQVGLLAIGLALSLFVQALRPLCLFFTVFLVLYLAEWGVNDPALRAQVQRSFASSDPFANALAFKQIQRFVIAGDKPLGSPALELVASLLARRVSQHNPA